jgi:hypothetical protein
MLCKTKHIVRACIVSGVCCAAKKNNKEVIGPMLAVNVLHLLKHLDVLMFWL